MAGNGDQVQLDQLHRDLLLRPVLGLKLWQHLALGTCLVMPTCANSSKACKGSSKPALGQACRIETLRFFVINSSAETFRESQTLKAS